MSKSHPLAEVGLSVSHFKCFGGDPGGFPTIQPINIIIGRNNSGKSTLIDLVELCIDKGKHFDPRKHGRPGSSFIVEVRQVLDEASLRNVFPEGLSAGGVPGRSHWEFGQQFVGQPLVRSYLAGWVPRFLDGPNLSRIQENVQPKYQNEIVKQTKWPFENFRLLKISAERDVKPEQVDNKLVVSANGTGATNLVSAFINREDLPRREINPGLLADLNAVYQGDCEFKAIICQINEIGFWELYLQEDAKGDIRLSQSGSSLKSVFVVLSMLRLVPLIENFEWNQVVLALEEPENNLHPALLRRLLNFLADQRTRKGFTLIITTHSPICIDWSTRRSDSQIIHVTHDGKAAHTRTAVEYQQNREILEDLDIRASDILQANGVIWVEGPSDRIYIRRWLELASDGDLKEGVHYTVMFYGGKLLNHLDALPPDESRELISLLAINRNAAVIIDSDRRAGKKGGPKPRMRINETKRRIKKELEDIQGFVWITEGREIENYTPIAVFARVAKKPVPKKVGIYDQISELPLLKEFKDKISLASAVAPQTQKVDLINHLDVWLKLEELCGRIRRWNAISK